MQQAASFLLGLLFDPEDGGDVPSKFRLALTGLHGDRRGNLSPTHYTVAVCPQLCISALLLLLAVVGAEDAKEKKHEKRGLLGLGYGTLGGYGVGSGLTGYSGSGLAALALPPAPVPVAVPASGPLVPPPPVYAPSHVIGTSVYTTVTKQVSTEVIPFDSSWI
jgi:hypothetical protein